MKNLFYLIMLCGLSAYSQSYTFYDPVTYKLGVTCSVDLCGPAPANSTTLMLTQQWCCPYYDPVNNVLYNNATPEEQAEYLADLEAAMVSPDAMFYVNETLISVQTDLMLTTRYPMQPENFRLVCTKIEFPGFAGSMTEYVKLKNGKWGRNMMLKNLN